MSRQNAAIYLGLIHAPVLNKRQETITTTITNLDLHDIARAGRTYSINRYYVINPLQSQQALARRMQQYWTSDYGGQYNSNRHEAFSVMEIASTLEDAVADIQRETGKRPRLIATSARQTAETIGYREMRELVSKEDYPFFLLFGTGWGLTRQVMQDCDFVLDPICGRDDFNHLSVRSAVSIILDRLLAQSWWVRD